MYARYNPDFALSLVPPEIQELAQRIEGHQGRALLVGGAVIDLLQGRVPKDWDIEVYGHTYADLVDLTRSWGLNPQLVGRAFGIIKLDFMGHDLDLNVPRKDSKIGIGHTGFEVLLDPDMTPKEAARRRDFTMNAMAVDLTTGELIDPFGGLSDLQAGILRATDPVKFVEDPLRALRGMQLLARKAKRVDPLTLKLVRSLSPTYPELVPERVYEEFRKLLLKAKKPSVGLEYLRRTDWLRWFPELDALTNTPQRLEWHAEGNVWNHTLLVVNAAARIRDTLPADKREAFMFAALLHDVGKPSTTVFDESDAALHLTSHGHDSKGVAIAENFMLRLTNNKRLIGQVKMLVGEHMKPYGLVTGDAKQGAYARLSRKLSEEQLTLRDLAAMSMADKAGSLNKGDTYRYIDRQTGRPSWEHPVSETLLGYAQRFEEQANLTQPLVLGRDLIALGFKPGPKFGPALQAALEVQLDNPQMSKEDLLEVAVAALGGHVRSNPRPLSRREKRERLADEMGIAADGLSLAQLKRMNRA